MSSPTSELAVTPLYETHKALGARMMPFGGFEMPVQYTSIMEEHTAVRTAAGLFDVSHMGEVLVSGPTAKMFVQQLVTNDANRLYPGKAMYTVMCNEEGGIIDDLLVYHLDEDEYMLVINAANISKDIAWMREHNPMEARLNDISSETALLALQGPRAFDIASAVTDLPLSDLQYYHFIRPKPGVFFGCRRAIISATGYTGERGIEIYCEAEQAADVWNGLLEAGEKFGLQPAGLGARDTLRIEAGYCLYGNDITEDTNPFEAGLGWLVKLEKGPFIGREALQDIKSEGLSRKLVAFVMNERGIPRTGYNILSTDEEIVGSVTSGTQSPVLQTGIGMGYVPNDPSYTDEGQPLLIGIRGKAVEASVKKPPLYKNNR